MMTPAEITPRPHDAEADEISIFDGLEAATAEAQTGCGDDNPYR